MSTDDRLHALRLAPLLLRIGLGVVTVTGGWAQVSHHAALISLWHALQLPGPAALGIGFEIAEICGGVLLIAGVLTRLTGLFLALALLAEILATKAPLTSFSGWAHEWQSFWMALALLVLGAGPVSLDAWFRARV